MDAQFGPQKPRRRQPTAIGTCIAVLACAPRVTADDPDMALVTVPARHDQPGGPTHHFRIGTHEVRNDQFIAFLNDALAGLDDPPGQYLLFDDATGDVFIHASATGEVGPNGRGTLLFSPAVNGRITFDGHHYALADEAFSDHPVTGVTWFGAVKFSNWLTWRRGMDPEAAAYLEGPTADDWQPARKDAESLLDLPGFRLPMDAAAATTHPFNEWHKAGSGRASTGGSPAFGAIYGFGRDVLTGADANFLHSGDTALNQTTPVGFFNGINLLHGGTPTNDTSNSYGLYDLTGNVAEWIHEMSAADATFTAAVRGGHFNTPATFAALRTDSRTAIPADSAFDFVGFRVAQAVTPQPLRITPADETLTTSGVFGGPFTPDAFHLQLQNPADYAMDDYSVNTEADWLEMDALQELPAFIPPGETIEVRLRLTDRAYEMLPLPPSTSARFRAAERRDPSPGRSTGPSPSPVPRRVTPHLPPPTDGHHVANVYIDDNIAVTRTTKRIVLSIYEPLTVMPLDDFEFTGPYCTDFAGRPVNLLLTNSSRDDMPWSLSISRPWLEVLEPPGLLNGTVPASTGPIPLTPALNERANALPPGTHRATLVLRNPRTGSALTRTVTVSVDPPFEVNPREASFTFSGIWQDTAFSPDTPETSWTLARCPDCPDDCDLRYRIETSQPWITVEPADVAEGPLPPQGQPMTFTVRINEQAALLGVGRHTANVQLFIQNAQGDPLSAPIDRPVELNVADPIALSAAADPWSVACEPGAPSEARRIELLNLHRRAEIAVEMTTDADWITVSPATLSILPGSTSAAVLSADAENVPTPGTYTVNLEVHDLVTGHLQTLPLDVVVGASLCVLPALDAEAAAAIGARPEPRSFRYTLTHPPTLGASAITWHAESSQPWVTLDGQLRIGGTLSPSESADLLVAIDTAQVPPLDPNQREALHQARLTFEDLTTAASVERNVRFTLRRPLINVNEQTVPASAAEPGGPEYPFRPAAFHTTNEEFVVFLNDAVAHPDHPRGSHLFFDTTTGDVYINSTVTGETGPDPGDRSALIFSPAAAAQIDFADGLYRVVTSPVDYARHPVTGVSWYGAVKYCNWLTLDQGLPPSHRCYLEGTHHDLLAWRPATITRDDWAARDLNDDERRLLVTQYLGFRLLMDDGYNNPTASQDSADRFNEWLEAAAWNPALNRHTVHGFGRDLLTPSDANFRCSGDPFEDPLDCTFGQTTPVGFYDGAERTVGGETFATARNENPFGLFDMTGNVHTWLQGRYAPPATLDRRTLRGGSWNDPLHADAFKNVHRPLFAPPALLSPEIGFRVVRTIRQRNGDIDGDHDVDLNDSASLPSCLTGPDAPHATDCTELDLDFDGDVDLSDAHRFLPNLTAAP